MNGSDHTAATNRLDEIEAEIVLLEHERDEIKSAVAILSRYETPSNEAAASVRQERGTDPAPQAVRNVPARTTRGVSGPPRPDGIPTLWEMTEQLLKGAPRHRLSTEEMVSSIGARWWPGVVRNQVAPQIYKFAKSNRLKQVGKGIFALPPDSASSEAETQKAEAAGNSPGLLELNNSPFG